MGRSSTGDSTSRRLRRWNGSSFEPIEPETLREQNVFVLSHGWARGLSHAVRSAGGSISVWDDGAVTRDGHRYDGWYKLLGPEIIERVPDAAVLGFSWVDDSATPDNALMGVRSQLRTSVNGQRLAVAIGEALDPTVDHDLHLIGFSHGAKVVAVAATLMEPLPRQVTLLDSPEGVLPILGGALNDLSSYLRILTDVHGTGSGPFIDNYPSLFGVRYGRQRGLGRVVDTVLHPERFPLRDHAHSPHSESIVDLVAAAHDYAWSWYLESARSPERGVGFGWSPILPGHAEPQAGQLTQRDPGDGESRDPLALEAVASEGAGGERDTARSRLRLKAAGSRRLSTEGPSSVRRAVWRRRGDIMAALPIDWEHGPDDASVVVEANAVVRARATKGELESANGRLLVPLGGIPAGLVLVTVRLESEEPAAVDVGGATTVYEMVLPAFSEARVWIAPVLAGAAAIAFAAGVGAVARRRKRRRRN